MKIKSPCLLITIVTTQLLTSLSVPLGLLPRWTHIPCSAVSVITTEGMDNLALRVSTQVQAVPVRLSCRQDMAFISIGLCVKSIVPSGRPIESRLEL